MKIVRYQGMYCWPECSEDSNAATDGRENIAEKIARENPTLVLTLFIGLCHKTVLHCFKFGGKEDLVYIV
jgi:hypothetical protein